MTRTIFVESTHPVSNSKDEWGTAFLELSKVVIEGFQETPIQLLFTE